MAPAGTKIPEVAQGTYKCGTRARFTPCQQFGSRNPKSLLQLSKW